MRTGLAVLFLASVICFSPCAFAQTVPANTPLPIKLDQTISSKNATVNQRVKAQLAQDVVIGGDIVLPKDAKVAMYVEKVQPGGDSTKPASLWLRVDAIAVHGRAYPVSALVVGQQLTPNSANADPPAAEGQMKDVSETKNAAFATSDSTANAGPPEIKFASATVLNFKLTSPLHMQ